MPNSDTRIVLNAELVSQTLVPVRQEVRSLYPGIVIDERSGEGSTSLVLDVQRIVLDGNGETCFESRGKMIALEYEAALNARLTQQNESPYGNPGGLSGASHELGGPSP